MKTRTILSFVLAFLVLSTAALAQDGGPLHRWTFNVGGGPTAAIGTMHNRLNTGWNFNAGGGLNVSNPFAIVAEFGYNSFGISDQALAAINVPGGSARIYSVTINPMLRFGYDQRIGGYVIGGGGWYRRTVEFTQPTTALVPFFDPWFGYFGQAAIPANQVIGSRTQDVGGANIGAGFTVGVAQGAKFYTEVRYHWMNAGAHNTTVLPVTFGLRW
jgi:hypothetical protein